jgi:hypothetical protein
MEVRTVLPSFLKERGWEIEFLNAGGASFPLRPSESREIITRLIPGAAFSPADVANNPDKTIHLYGYAAGILVGGMSYNLDPSLKPPQPAGECKDVAEALLNCVELPRGKVRSVRIRKVNVDIEFEDECLDR